jgi:hypothetical protein
MNILIMLLLSFLFIGLAGGVYPLLSYYISEFSRWFKWIAIIFWVSYFSGLILAIISLVSLTKV